MCYTASNSCSSQYIESFVQMKRSPICTNCEFKSKIFTLFCSPLTCPLFEVGLGGKRRKEKKSTSRKINWMFVLYQAFLLPYKQFHCNNKKKSWRRIKLCVPAGPDHCDLFWSLGLVFYYAKMMRTQSDTFFLDDDNEGDEQFAVCC